MFSPFFEVPLLSVHFNRVGQEDMLRRSILLHQHHPGTAPYLTSEDLRDKKSPSIPVRERYDDGQKGTSSGPYKGSTPGLAKSQRYLRQLNASSGQVGAPHPGTERLGEKVRRAVTGVRERVAAAKRLTWSAFFARYPIVPFVGLGWLWGYRARESPQASSKLPPELHAQVKP